MNVPRLCIVLIGAMWSLVALHAGLAYGASIPPAPIETAAQHIGEMLSDECMAARGCWTLYVRTYYPDGPPDHLRDTVDLDAWATHPSPPA